MIAKYLLPPVVAALIIVGLLGLLRYQSAHHKIEIVEVAQDLDMSTLRFRNHNCKVTGQNGESITLTEGKNFIPKGALITSECFEIQSAK